MTEFDQNQENNQSMEDAMKNVQKIKVGNVVKGEVLVIGDEQMIVGIEGAGVEGVVPAKELSALPVKGISEIVKVGDASDLVVIGTIGRDKENDSYLLLERRLDAKKVWEDIEGGFQEGKVIEASVTNVVRGGLVVDVGIRGSIPASMVEDRFVVDFSGYKGKTLSFKTVEIEPSKSRLILSHKAVVENEREGRKKGILSTIHEGGVLSGRVARLTDFGVLVGLGGIDGLIHISEVSRSHIAKPSDILAVNDDVNVKVSSINLERERVSLPIKDTQLGPRSEIDTKAPVDTVLDGTVRHLTSFGVFVGTFLGIEGLVHISQISHKHITIPHEVLHEGDEVKVKVLEIYPEERRIALNVKALEEEPASEEEPKDVESYELPKENTGSTMGGILGDVLKEKVEEEATDDSKK